MELQIDQQARGVRIVTGKEAEIRRWQLDRLSYIANQHGFEEIVLPTIEPAAIS